MVQEELISIREGGQGDKDLGQDIIKYLQRLGVTDNISDSKSKEDLMMISIKKKRSSSKNIDTTTKESITLRQQIKELIDIIGYREQPIYRECCLDDICKVLQEHIDAKIHNWIESFEHNQLKEKE